ncbi:MAG: TMEM175 family protein [Methanoregula sp.]|nr:TMEM175 family protein [Methanoregula sp.]
MGGNEGTNPHHISKDRLETIVDAIFAFAMTLLALGIQVPQALESYAAVELPGYIHQLIPQFILFVIAFLVLITFWIEHHRQFHYLRIVDPTILSLNVAILIFTVLIPFTTDVAGNYDRVEIAVILFHANILIIGALFVAHWKYISRSSHLCDAEFDAASQEKRFWILATIPAVAIFGILVSVFSPPYSLLVYIIALIVYIIRNWFSRYQEQKKQLTIV